MPAHTQRLRALEFAALFILLPLVIAWQGETMRRWIIPQLLLLTVICLVLLWRDASFDRHRLMGWPHAWRPCLLRIAIVLVIGGAAVLALASRLPGADPFALPQQRPVLWLAILLLYPLISALPQELIFRVFFFHRYRALFPDPRTLPLVSAGVFALAHLVLGNWVAVLLSLAGGLLFAYNYARTGSLGLVTLEHGLWGDWLFTVGMGSYFYGGHV
ncbi:MAG: CPBP family intramembrane glutamic endopeptidase [Thiobacillaceae bacterium]